MVEANSAGRMIVLIRTPKPVTAPSIIGADRSERLTLARDQNPSSTGMTSAIVLTIVETVSRLKV